MWETWIHDSKTGAPVERVHPAEATWSTSIAGDGTGRALFKVDDEETALPRALIWSLFTPNARMIVHRWGSFVGYAGKIDAWEYDRDKATVEVLSVELRKEFRWRLTAGVPDFVPGPPPPATLSVTNRSHSGAARAVLARAMQWSADWAYPIDLPADGSGSFSATWDWYKKFKISDLLTQIEAEGPEIYLRPYLTAGALRFQTLVAPQVTVGSSSFFLRAEESPLDKVRYKLDGSQQLTGLLGVGNGTGVDQATAWAGGGPYAIPIRDAKREFPDLTGTRLQAATTAALAADEAPLAQWSVGGFQVSDDWGAAHAAPGRVWHLNSRGDPVIPDGTHSLRVVRLSGGLGTTLETEVQHAGS